MEPTTPNPAPTNRSNRKGGRAFHKPACNCAFCKVARKRSETPESESEGARRSTSATPPALIEVLQAEGFVVEGRSRKDRIAQWITLRQQGLRNNEIAAKLGISINTLTSLISKANREGWLKFDSPADRLEYELAPKIVDNVAEFLNSDNDAHRLKMTIESAKGVGLFKAHQAVKVENEGAQMILAIKIENPPGFASSAEPLVEGVIVGKPRLPGVISAI